jgi:hypothetical protein
VSLLVLQDKMVLLVLLVDLLVVAVVLEILLVMKFPLQQWRDRRFTLDVLQTDHHT